MNQQTYDSNPNLVEKIKSLGGNIRIDPELPDGVVVLDNVVMPADDAYRLMLKKAIEQEKKLMSYIGEIRRYSARNEKRLRRKQLEKQQKLEVKANEELKRMGELVHG